MKKTNKNEIVVSFLQKTFPDAKCALIFDSSFQCLVAVMLSAQTTDIAVNKCTPALFSDYPDAKSLSKADQKDVENHIHSLGLYKNKASNLIAMSKALMERFSGEVPSTKEELCSLPGVGNKTASVVLLECFGVPGIAVDTHVGRIAKRLGYAKESDEPTVIQEKLEKTFTKQEQEHLHHQLIWFGRTICHAKKPECERCGLQDICHFFKKCS